jgi:site-specific recombinase XerD
MHDERLNYSGTNKDRPLPKIFSQEDIGRIITQPLRCKNYWSKKGYADWGEFLKMRDVCILATIYILGLRPNEACSLKFEDFDFKNRKVIIRGENNKCKKDRILPVPASLMKFYKQYLVFPRSRFWRASKYLFPSFSRDHVSASTLKFIMREKVLKPLNLWNFSETRTTYKLRHSRASHLLAKQIEDFGRPDIFAIANILGHADIRSTQVYLHTDEKYTDYLREMMN